ncbi:EamA family transporter [Caldalkalibacillus mannanilyticus]|uniref:EamA family transporter n=1 Tax=Caldalkalibacillus mannanilyticus TaxID=1418 RepID=UPI0006884AA3|nr:DMT family transporter [Caldalkalibacillus mannanilyticus]
MSNRAKGYLMVIFAAIFWGLSGTVAQFLFQHKGFDAAWLVTMRLIIAGIILLVFASHDSTQSIFTIWRSPRNGYSLLVFGIMGMVGVQYTYFASIQEGNAAVATLLQYLAPMIIMLYVISVARKLPSIIEAIALLLALTGIFLLVTNGTIQGLSVSKAALIWGILSAVALAFYTLYPARLLAQFGSATVIGWAMLIGGIVLSVFRAPWEMEGQVWSFSVLLCVAFIIFFGTLLAFYLYLDSLRYLRATETSMLATAEPLAAVIASVIWLQTSFGFYEMLGGLCIMTTVIILAIPQEKKNIELSPSLKQKSDPHSL